ncbi:uncharacterized protein LOC144098426 [Amblyomma americanum]
MSPIQGWWPGWRRRNTSKPQLHLLSEVWLALRAHPKAQGCLVREIMAVCRSFMDGKYAASRLRSGAEPKFRRFVRYWPHYFDYDREQDTIAVARHSPSSAADEWVVRYLALRIEESPSGCLAIGGRTRCSVGHPSSHRNGTSLWSPVRRRLASVSEAALRRFHS